MSRRRRHVTTPPADARFWGRVSDSSSSSASDGAGAVRKIRPTSDPGAIARSLGNSPLSVGQATVRRTLDAVYEEAVRAATALAAANGLLDDSSSD